MVNFKNGELVKGAYVVIDGKEYEVHMPQYSGETPLSSENLNKLQKDLNDKITNANIYSTSEINTGKKWKDGKDIYRKVIELSNIPVSTTEYSYNVENINKIVNAQASWYDTTDMATFSSNLRYDSAGAYIKFTYLKDKFKVETAFDWSKRTSDVSVIIEYTKRET
jgi:hypothetical protein